MTSAGRTIRFDPHVHTNASFDARGSVEAVLAEAAAAGLDALAITDHDTTAAVEEALALAADLDLTVVPGVEVSTAAGHLLALGVRDAPPRGRPLSATIDTVRSAGGVAVIPHPFQRTRHGVRKRDLTDCDGIEVFNAWAMTGLQNRRARRLADRRDYPTLGGSDAHEPVAVGRAYTELTLGDDPAPATTTEAVLDAITAGRTRAVGTTTSVRRYLGKYTKAVRRHVSRRVPKARL